MKNYTVANLIENLQKYPQDALVRKLEIKDGKLAENTLNDVFYFYSIKAIGEGKTEGTFNIVLIF